MNRNLVKQMRHEWRDNIWLAIELLIIGIVIWILSLLFARLMRDRFTERGFDIENVYTLDINTLSESNPQYVAPDTTLGKEGVTAESIRTLLAQLRRSPYVEAAALSEGALPYNFNFYGVHIEIEPAGSNITYKGNVRCGSPEIIRVIQPRPLDGMTLADMETALGKGEILISPNPDTDATLDTRSLIGKRGSIQDFRNSARIAGRIYSIRRSDYQPPIGTVLLGIDENNDQTVSRCFTVALRVKPGMNRQFIEQFESSQRMHRSGNIIFENLTDMRDVRSINQRNTENTIRLTQVGTLFFLAIIFLGLIGSFWFRVQQRKSEIALRKTCGATNRDIMARSFGEGYLLLVAAAIPGTLIAAAVSITILPSDGSIFDSEKETLIFAALSWVATQFFLFITITLGLLWPTLRALAIEPADALKTE